MTTKLRILYVCAELAPLVKTGGLGDVANALPRALHARGHDVRLALPLYRCIPEQARGERRAMCSAHLGDQDLFGALRETTLPGTDIPLYLIEHDLLLAREHPYGTKGQDYGDNLERFSFFCAALPDAISQTGWIPDVVHCNDWHTALLPAYLNTRHRRDRVWRNVASIFTIHSLVYQGCFPGWDFEKTGLSPDLYTPEGLEFYGQVNLMKAGIRFADKVNTVSKTYAQEILTPEYGNGLEGFLRTRSKDLSGILNGADGGEWHPQQDPHIEASYSENDLAGKKQCKAALQKLAGFPETGVPVLGLVSRLCWEKGVDLLADALKQILQRDVQVVVLGTGMPEYEKRFATLAQRHPKKLCAFLKYHEPLAHRVYAGCDFFLMPSRTEPCGLSQMYALAYGSVPIVRKTGGLADTVVDVTPKRLKEGAATGIAFRSPTPGALVKAVDRALVLYEKPDALETVRRAGMRQDFSWDASCAAYEQLYREAIAKKC